MLLVDLEDVYQFYWRFHAENVIDFPSDGHSNVVIADLPTLYLFLFDHGEIAGFLNRYGRPLGRSSRNIATVPVPLPQVVSILSQRGRGGSGDGWTGWPLEEFNSYIDQVQSLCTVEGLHERPGDTKGSALLTVRHTHPQAYRSCPMTIRVYVEFMRLPLRFVTLELRVHESN